jgi:formate dehydrogenase iron-sulfur subunit
MHKCDLCGERVREGLKPACVKVCPFEALLFGNPNDVQANKELKCIVGLMEAVR